LKKLTVTSVFEPRDLTYVADDCTIRVNDEIYGTMHNFSLPYTRTVTMIDSTEPGEQIVKVNAPTVSGEAVIELDPLEFNTLLATDVKSMAITMTKGDGEKAVFTYDTATFYAPEIQITGNEPRLMKAMIKPTGKATAPMVKVAIQTATNWSV